ncbi:MAG: VPLPA-CTERM sorting domain-containing protein [Gammaproteobacteria bacterium]
MKKYLLAIAALGLFASGANAAPINYQLSSIKYANLFAPTPTDVTACTGCGIATATDDGAGNITLTGIAYSYTGGGNSYTTSYNATTTLAIGTSLIKDPGATCVDITGTNCVATNVIAGLGGNFYTGIGSDLVTACANDRCRVDVSNVGSDLVVQIKRALSASPTSTAFQQYTMTFAVVPVPAAVWLFGSALGLMGLARRKTA